MPPLEPFDKEKYGNRRVVLESPTLREMVGQAVDRIINLPKATAPNDPNLSRGRYIMPEDRQPATRGFPTSTKNYGIIDAIRNSGENPIQSIAPSMAAGRLNPKLIDQPATAPGTPKEIRSPATELKPAHTSGQYSASKTPEEAAAGNVPAAATNVQPGQAMKTPGGTSYMEIYGQGPEAREAYAQKQGTDLIHTIRGTPLPQDRSKITADYLAKYPTQQQWANPRVHGERGMKEYGSKLEAIFGVEHPRAAEQYGTEMDLRGRREAGVESAKIMAKSRGSQETKMAVIEVPNAERTAMTQIAVAFNPNKEKFYTYDPSKPMEGQTGKSFDYRDFDSWSDTKQKQFLADLPGGPEAVEKFLEQFKEYRQQKANEGFAESDSKD